MQKKTVKELSNPQKALCFSAAVLRQTNRSPRHKRVPKSSKAEAAAAPTPLSPKLTTCTKKQGCQAREGEQLQEEEEVWGVLLVSAGASHPQISFS